MKLDYVNEEVVPVNICEAVLGRIRQDASALTHDWLDILSIGH